MFEWLKRKPKLENDGFSDLSYMLSEDKENPVYKLETLDPEKLDFSIDSLSHIDDYLDSVRGQELDDGEFMKVVLRVGAYVGQVIRAHSSEPYDWLIFDQALKVQPQLAQFGQNLGTAGMLWSKPDKFLFPLAKVMKFLENGREDSVHVLAKVACSPEGLADA